MRLVQCPKFEDAWEVWVAGDSWMIQQARIESNRDSELNDPANKNNKKREDDIRNRYKVLLEGLKTDLSSL